MPFTEKDKTPDSPDVRTVAEGDRQSLREVRAGSGRIVVDTKKNTRKSVKFSNMSHDLRQAAFIFAAKKNLVMTLFFLVFMYFVIVLIIGIAKR